MEEIKLKHLIKKLVKEEVDTQLKNKNYIDYEDLKVLLNNYLKYKQSLIITNTKLSDIDNGTYILVKNNDSEDKVQNGSLKYVSDFEKKENEKRKLLSYKQKLKYIIEIIEFGLEYIRNDEYYEIIRLRYFEKLRGDEIQEQLYISKSTYNRHHKRLIKELKTIMFNKL